MEQMHARTSLFLNETKTTDGNSHDLGIKAGLSSATSPITFWPNGANTVTVLDEFYRDHSVLISFQG